MSSLDISEILNLASKKGGEPQFNDYYNNGYNNVYIILIIVLLIFMSIAVFPKILQKNNKHRLYCD